MVLAFAACANNSETKENEVIVKEEFVCMPCGSACDDSTYASTGECVHCKMELVKKSSIVFERVLPQDLYEHIHKAGTENIVLLDVRTPQEFNGTAEEKFGRLKNAINIPVQELASRLNELQKYKDKEIIVYCSHSHRSPRASYLLTQNGFARVTNMEHGMHMWKSDISGKIKNDSLYIAQ
jgi:rhodanese-related sulfurtransferase